VDGFPNNFESVGWGFESLRVRQKCGGFSEETATFAVKLSLDSRDTFTILPICCYC
jgi:hypothetical protein